MEASPANHHAVIRAAHARRSGRRFAGRELPPTHSRVPYLDIRNLSAAYGATRVLDDVSLSVDKGELVALLGSSGCGKTTLLRAIAGFVVPTAGSIVVDGRDITALPPEARGTAMMFQSYALWPHLTWPPTSATACACAAGRRMRSPRASPRC